MRASTTRSSSILLLLLSLGCFLAFLQGCAGTVLSTENSSPGITVSVSPGNASVQTGVGTQNFTATVSNDAKNEGVTWAISGTGCSGSSCGTLSNVTTTSVTYTAPTSVPSPATVTLTATSVADTTKSSSATITVTSTAVISVTIAPINPSVQTTIGTQNFTATLQNDTQNKGVTWSLSGTGCSGATCGTLSNVTTTSVTYTAPAKQPSPDTVTITATSVADTTKSASTTITITPPITVSVAPATASLVISTEQQFTATVSNDAQNEGVTWAVSGAGCSGSDCGTLTNVTTTSVTYTAPGSVPSPATVTLTATSNTEPSVSGSAVITITSNTSSGATFYVSPSGSDSNPGTITAPWLTIQHAANSVQAGDTVYVRAGSYNESVTIGVSGSATAGPIVFENYPGENPIVDGTGLTPSDSNTQGLFNIADQSYITISGFEIRNYTTSNANATPAGIWISGSGTTIQILNNQVHNITTTSEKNGNAFGISVYGTEAPASLDSVTISGNTVYDLKTGNSESVNVDGNVTNFVITNNVVHDNDNIGIDAIGFEGVSPDPTYDYARNGLIGENTVYNISAINNPGEGDQYDADGIYVDGGSQIIIERNNVSTSDLGIEVASEHSGHYGSYVTVRNNLVYFNNSVGISIGGYASNVGGTQYCTIVNNSLLGNDTKNTGSGELQVQYYATNNVFENNIVYATSQGLLINNYTNSEASPLTADYNLYFSPLSESSVTYIWNGTTYTGFTTYQTATNQDAHSLYADPLYLSLTTPNLQVEASSPAVNAGINLGPTIVGTVDYAGNPRVQGTNIDIGAYEQ